MDILWLREVEHNEVLEYPVVEVIGLVTGDNKGKIGYLVSSGSTGMIDVAHGNVMSD